MRERSLPRASAKIVFFIIGDPRRPLSLYRDPLGPEVLLNDDIDLEDVQGELETRAKFMFVPLQRMIDAKEISSAEITVPEGQEETILEDETMRVKIRYVSRGYIREVEVDLGRAQPSD